MTVRDSVRSHPCLENQWSLPKVESFMATCHEHDGANCTSGDADITGHGRTWASISTASCFPSCYPQLSQRSYQLNKQIPIPAPLSTLISGVPRQLQSSDNTWDMILATDGVSASDVIKACFVMTLLLSIDRSDIGSSSTLALLSCKPGFNPSIPRLRKLFSRTRIVEPACVLYSPWQNYIY